MNRHLLRTTLVLVLCTLLGSVALAGGKGKSKTITLGEDVTVGSTLVKKGTYKASFDDQSGELTLWRDNKLVVKTTARLEEHKNKSLYVPAYKTRRESDGGALTLTSVYVGGAYAVIGADGGSTTTGANMQ